MYRDLQEVLAEDTQNAKQQSSTIPELIVRAPNDSADATPSPTSTAYPHASTNDFALIHRSKSPHTSIFTAYTPSSPELGSQIHPAPLPPHSWASPPMANSLSPVKPPSSPIPTYIAQFSPSRSLLVYGERREGGLRHEFRDGENTQHIVSRTVLGETEEALGQSGQSCIKSSTFANLSPRVGEVQHEETRTNDVRTSDSSDGEERPKGEGHRVEEAATMEQDGIKEAMTAQQDPPNEKFQAGQEANPDSNTYVGHAPHKDGLLNPLVSSTRLQEHHCEGIPCGGVAIAEPDLTFNMRKFALRLWVLVMLVGMMFFAWS